MSLKKVIRRNTTFTLTTIDFKEFKKYQKALQEIQDFNQLPFTIKGLKKTQKRFTILRSPHVNKKARDQLERRYFRLKIQVNNPFFYKFIFVLFSKINQTTLRIDGTLFVSQKLYVLFK